MNRDPFYQQILQRLNGTLDPFSFEHCAVDLLHTVDKLLVVPVCGGTDYGMDGAIADGEGPAYPLVCTTQKDVIGNLMKNLHSNLDHEGQRRKVMLATSQPLGGRKRRNLENKAAEMGFTLVQIYDRAAIADRLYDNPKWCRELLNLTGEPSALSLLPRSARLMRDLPLIGRDDDLRWLCSTNGDRLIVGQPGAGKTSLLLAYARANNALFATQEDIGAIVRGYREKQPDTIIVDDASEELLVTLRHLREETGATFSILASCWPGAKKETKSALCLDSAHIRELDRLTRDNMVDVIKHAGILGPEEVIREIVNQSEGLPGFAVTLVTLSLNGDIHQVMVGDILSQEMLHSLRRYIGRDTAMLLAAFALGGDAGMRMVDVAEILGQPVNEVFQTLRDLVAGGVIHDRGDNTVAVRPHALRFTLVRDTFFGEDLALPYYDSLLQKVLSPKDAGFTLIGARARGGHVPDDLIFNLAERDYSNEVWIVYASLGPAEAVKVLKARPDLLIDIAYTALIHIPEEVIPQLLTLAVGDNRPLHSHTEHPIRLIQDWIKSVPPGSEQALPRRQKLLSSAVRWLAVGGDTTVGVQALVVALSPRWKTITVDPGCGNTFVTRSGVIAIDDLRACEGLWSQCFTTLKKIIELPWSLILDAIADWVYPGRATNSVLSDEHYKIMHALARLMITDLIDLTQSNPAVLHRLNQYASVRQLATPVPTHPLFELLYADIPRDMDWSTFEQIHAEKVHNLAEEWSNDDPQHVIAQLEQCLDGVESTDHNGPDWLSTFLWHIAEIVPSHNPWLDAIMTSRHARRMVHPFLYLAAKQQDGGWEQYIESALEDDQLRQIAIDVVISIHGMPDILTKKVLCYPDNLAPIVQILSLRQEIEESVLQILLQHPDDRVAVNTSLGMWYATTPHGEIPLDLQSDWEQALLRCKEGEVLLGEILASNPQLAFVWLQRRLSEGIVDPYYPRNPIEQAITVFDSDARREILDFMPDNYEASNIVQQLVGDNLDTYVALLRNQRLQNHHLVPLQAVPDNTIGETAENRAPDEVWIAKALCALDAGYTPQDVAHAVVGLLYGWAGKESIFWEARRKWFADLKTHPEERIRAVAQSGIDFAVQNYERAFRSDRHRDVFGD